MGYSAWAEALRARNYWNSPVSRSTRTSAQAANAAYQAYTAPKGTGPRSRRTVWKKVPKRLSEFPRWLRTQRTARKLIGGATLNKYRRAGRSQRNKMPYGRGYRRGRKRRKGRRKAKGRYQRRARRSRRRPRRIQRIRLYPGGVPLTHMIKLKSMKQMLIHTRPLEWGRVEFSPASMLQPLLGSALTASVNTDQQTLSFLNKADNAVPLLAQPYGYDHWLGNTGDNIYRKYKVLGSKITIRLTPSSNSPDSGSHFYAGWSRLCGQDDNYGEEFDKRYVNATRLEIADMLNIGVIKKVGTITSTTGRDAFKTFTFRYSWKKYNRSLRRRGINPTIEAWHGTHGSEPGIVPRCYFIVADMGTSTSIVKLNVMVTHEYTVQLSGLRIGQESEHV